MDIFGEAKADLKSRGVDQWQNGYPDRSAAEADIKAGVSYVSERGGKIAATAAISFEKENCYEHLTGGRWLIPCERKYAVIHRIAASAGAKRKGAASELLDHAVSLCRKAGAESIKIDTHRDNKVMQRWLEKHGFIYCGCVKLDDGGERIAFEKLIL